MSEPRFTNRLIHEKSPYLLQHAHNPVDWYPWGDEAFTASKIHDRPIFLSIGYATCHWCHVMEKESFEDEEIASLLNKTFVCVKVDREELPEVDALYMDFAQAMMAGVAGWPLNLVLTPDLKPFFAATYIPPASQPGAIGMKEFCEQMEEVWQGEQKEMVLAQSEQVYDAFASHELPAAQELPSSQLVAQAAEVLFELTDPVFGGVKGAPKFPMGYQINFMLRYGALHQDSRAMFWAERTLDRMQRGGIYDHLGGGFSRYSVDEEWLVPHFEKMLYDNALLLSAYTEAWRVLKKPFYSRIAREIGAYLLRDMRDEAGGFHSAQDADTEGQEGRYYTWTESEINNILGPDAALFKAYYGVTAEGNFEGRNILHIDERVPQFAEEMGLDPDALREKLAANRELLRIVRQKREQPLKDDKVLVAWNGLTIHALAEAGMVLNEPEWLNAAEKAAHFIEDQLVRDGRLLRRWRDGEARYQAGLDEYAFLIQGLLTLFEASSNSEWLAWAMQLTHHLESDFLGEQGTFYQTDGSDPSIILRRVHSADGAEPSGNSVHMDNLVRLYGLTADDHYLRQAEGIMKGVSLQFSAYSPGYMSHALAWQRYFHQQASTVVVAFNPEREHETELRQLLSQSYQPHRSIIWRMEEDRRLMDCIPFVSNQGPLKGNTTLYICRHGSCQAPVTELSDMIAAVHRL